MAEMESQAILGKGTLLFRGLGDGPPETFQQVAEVGDIPLPAAEADEVEVTHQASPGKYQEFIPGLIDPGEMSFEVNWLPAEASHVALFEDAATGIRRNWQVRVNDLAHTMFSFKGWIKKVEPVAPVNGKLSANVMLRVTSLISRGNW